jgi:hypothetical protein
MFKINRNELTKTERVLLGDWTEEYLQQIEDQINNLIKVTDTKVVQKGRVIALRFTDINRLFSAFKAGVYLGKYDDLDNDERFLTKMVKAHHSYEPIRGESVLFLFIGVGKPIYDHLVTYSVGRYTRIAGGQRANLPWGLEIPVETKDREGYAKRNWQRIEDVINLTGNGDEEPQVKEQIQSARSELPVGYVMPPFLMEFSEEALIKSVFRQRLFEKGAQGATINVVDDMIQCCLEVDPVKWETLIDYHGSHTVGWEKAMRTLRDKEYNLGDLIKKSGVVIEDINELLSVDVYTLLMETVGRLPKSMWEK